MTVTILGKTLPVTLPTRHAERWELTVLYAANLSRGAAAILGLCVPGLTAAVDEGGLGLAVLGDLRTCRYDMGEYGARVWEALHAAKVDEADIAAAAAPIFTRLAELSMPTAAEVKERVGFSEASAEG